MYWETLGLRGSVPKYEGVRCLVKVALHTPALDDNKHPGRTSGV